MDLDWADITHITKIDPVKAFPADIEVLEYTDLVIVGGSDGVTETNTLEAIRRVKESFPKLQIVQEPYTSTQVSIETIATVDVVGVPAIFNGDRDHFVGKHLEMFSQLGSDFEELQGQDASISVVVDKLVAVGYVIQNTDSKAATVSGVDESLSAEQIRGAALATEIFYGFPVFYVEYSGMFGGTADIEAAAPYLEDTVLLYGGGISSAHQASEVLLAGADAVVVGDCFHDDPDAFAQTTRLSSAQ
ncbi:geranylgeranylglyceryl/heptaprenylglyceryl phosphate synthase [Halalkalicoccus salilacus]|uniref:heptaprenylglyceryl phosphate synthase n=1 Tax=Halalkalicoccus TaxID=332246 RepID=UPI002F967580